MRQATDILVLFAPAWNIALISGFPSLYTSLLDRVESKAIHSTGNPSFTTTLDPLSLHRKMASLSLFYHYYFGHCSDELVAYIPSPMAQPRSTWQATFAHSYCVQELIGSVMASSLLLLNFGTISLLLYFQFPSTFLPSKGWSITTLGTRWHDFSLLPFLDILQKLFYSFHYISFPFLKGCRLKKRHFVHVLCSQSLKCYF